MGSAKKISEYILGVDDNPLQDVGDNLKQQVRLEKEYQKSKAFLDALNSGQTFADNDLKQIALDQAKEEKRKEGKEAVLSHAKALFENLKQRRDIATNIGTQGFADAEKQGIGALSKDITGKHPDIPDPGIGTKINNVLLKGARSVEAAFFGPNQSIMPKEQDWVINKVISGETPKHGEYRTRPEYEEDLRNIPRSTISGAFKNAWENNTDIAQQMSSDAMLRYKQAALNQAKNELGATGDKQLILNRAKELTNKMIEADSNRFIIKHPIATDIMGQVALDPLNFINPIGKAGALMKALPEAVGQASRVLPQASKLLPAAEKVAQYGPAAMHGTILGSIPGGNVLPFVGGALGIGLKTEKGAQIADTLFSHLPQAAKLRRAGYGALADEIELNRASTTIETKGFGEEVSKIIEQHKLSAEESAQLFNAIKNPSALEAYDPKVGLAYDDYVNKLMPMRIENVLNSPAGRVIEDTGVIRQAKPKSNYVAQKVLDPAAQDINETRIFESHPKQSNAAVSAAYHQTEDADRYLKDPFAQLTAKLKEEAPKLQSAKEIAALDKTLQRHNMVHYIEPDAPLEQIKSQVAELSKRDGIPYTILGESKKGSVNIVRGEYSKGNTTLSDIYNQITLPAGENVRSRMVVIPEAAKEVVEKLYPIISGSKQVSGFEKGYNTYLKPWMDLMKKGMTMGGGYAFSVRNTILAPQMDFLGRGIDAINPKMWFKSAKASYHMASGDWKQAETALEHMGSFKNRTGQEFTWKEIGNLYKENFGVTSYAERAGVTDTLQTALQADPSNKFLQIAKAAPQMANAAFDKILYGNVPGLNKIKGISPGRLANAAENFQHLNTFASVLEGKTKADIAKAVRMTSEITSNYSRMSDIEKKFVTQIIPFYGWAKFAGPTYLKAAIENPQRLATFLKVRMAERAALGDEDQGNWTEKKDFLRGNSFTIARNIGKDPDKFAEMLYNDPITAGQSILSGAFNLAAGKGNESEQDFNRQMGNQIKMVSEWITGRDFETGNKLDSSYDRFVAPALPVIAGVGQRPAKIVKNIVDLGFKDAQGDYAFKNIKDMAVFFAKEKRPDLAFKYWMMFQAARDITGLDVYYQDERRNVLHTKSRAAETLGISTNPYEFKKEE